MPRARPPRTRRSPSANGTPAQPSTTPASGAPAPTDAAAATPPSPAPAQSQRPRPQAEPDAGYVAVGRVLGAFGLKGELKVQSLTDNDDRFAPKSKLWAGQQPVSVATSRFAQGLVYLTLKGFPDRDAVEPFRHAMLQIPEDTLPPLEEGEYYRFQLIGLDVVDREGAPLGTLAEIIETGSNDVYRVHTPEGPGILLAALDDVIVTIDLAAKRMVVDPPDWR